MFVNTVLFSEAANTFRREGVYTNALPGTKEYLDYWRIQRDRCLDGYEVGGIPITGEHYFYLNFFPIMRFSDDAMYGLTKQRKQKKELDFPSFWDGDYSWFWSIEIARNGITPELYAKIKPFMLITIPEYAHTGGRHLINLKARRKGYSYKNGALLLRNYYFGKLSINYIFASEEKYLFGDATLDKIWIAMNHNDSFAAWKQPRLKNVDLNKKCGYKKLNESGILVDAGKQNSIEGITFYNDPEKGRGKNGDYILFEEAGKFPNLIKSWIITQQTVEQGGYIGGTMIAFGTGGSEHEDALGLSELFYNPASYNILPIINEWDEDMFGQECGYFVPVYQNKEGFMDKEGNSFIQKAKESEEKKRNDKKKGTQEAYKQYTSEMPFNPQEATLQSNTNIFPTKLISEHRNRVIAKKLNKLGVIGTLTRHDNKVKFHPDDKLMDVDRYPHRLDSDLRSGIVIYESPIRLATGIPDGLYYIAHDSYAIDGAADKTSLGGAYVMKRNSRISSTFPDLPVAKYIGRPDTQEEYNYNMFLLAEYYGCTNEQIAFENNRGNTIEYARKNKKLHWLAKDFSSDSRRDTTGINVVESYGTTMTAGRNKQSLLYIRDWLLEVVGKNEMDGPMYRLEFIYDLGLLDELIYYNDKGNFDRVSTLKIAMFYMKENEDKPVKDKKPVSSHLAQLNSFYNDGTVQHSFPTP